MNTIGAAFEELAQGLRILLEADYRANRENLLSIDRAEAVGNIEAALTGVLNAFHSLEDAINKELKNKRPINWYQSPELAVILVIRNARHHNKGKRIRTLYTYYVQEAKKIGSMEEYILVDFVTPEKGADTFDVYVSWNDLKNLLESPIKESLIKENTNKSITKYLNTNKYPEYADYYKISESRVFLNIIPLIVNAAATIIPLIKDYCKPDSIEASSFIEHFSNVTKADTSIQDVTVGPFALTE